MSTNKFLNRYPTRRIYPRIPRAIGVLDGWDSNSDNSGQKIRDLW
jgi:hypothetical protein